MTGQRRWVDETTKELAADMTVEGKIWFTPLATKSMVQMLWAVFKNNGWPFPADKAHAIRVTTHLEKAPDQPIFPVRQRRLGDKFPNPEFALHPQAGPTATSRSRSAHRPHRNEVVDDFNQIVMYIFNLWSGNLLTPGNPLSWSVWFNARRNASTSRNGASMPRSGANRSTPITQPGRSGDGRPLLGRHTLQAAVRSRPAGRGRASGPFLQEHA